VFFFVLRAACIIVFFDEHYFSYFGKETPLKDIWRKFGASVFELGETAYMKKLK